MKKNNDSPSHPEFRILFVCLGNICRSPAAETIFTQLLEQAHLEGIFVDSAGILNYHEGETADPRMVQHAVRRGYCITSRSRPVTTEDFSRFDLMIGMDDRNIRDLRHKAPQGSGCQIRKMTDFASASGRIQEVPDPYYGGADGFEKVLDLLEECAAGLLAVLKTERA